MNAPTQPVTTGATSLPERSPGLLVYLCGIATTALVVLLVQALNGADFNAMGLYANGIIPVGALLVGMASGTGYALGSRFLNVKLSKGFVAGMVATGVADWFGLQYFEYASILEEARVSPAAFGFFDYLTQSATSISFSRAGSSSPGAELGNAGYFFKALELTGFALGTMIPSSTLSAMPYCHRCRVYLKLESKHTIGSEATRSEIMKLDRMSLKNAQRAVAFAAAQDDVRARAAGLHAEVELTPLPVVRRALRTLTDAAARKDSAATATVVLKKCPHCDNHHLTASLSSFAPNGKAAAVALWTADKTDGFAEAPEMTSMV
jgi:hypothetical protein